MFFLTIVKIRQDSGGGLLSGWPEVLPLRCGFFEAQIRQPLQQWPGFAVAQQGETDESRRHTGQLVAERDGLVNGRRRPLKPLIWLTVCFLGRTVWSDLAAKHNA